MNFICRHLEQWIRRLVQEELDEADRIDRLRRDQHADFVRSRRARLNPTQGESDVVAELQRLQDRRNARRCAQSQTIPAASEGQPTHGGAA